MNSDEEISRAFGRRKIKRMRREVGVVEEATEGFYRFVVPHASVERVMAYIWDMEALSIGRERSTRSSHEDFWMWHSWQGTNKQMSWRPRDLSPNDEKYIRRRMAYLSTDRGSMFNSFKLMPKVISELEAEIRPFLGKEMISHHVLGFAQLTRCKGSIRKHMDHIRYGEIIVTVQLTAPDAIVELTGKEVV
mmetsp:Transcript_44712/g.74631  ORF Transcript_44712/g.74631 Transcript_44712/m.74631 type:complete len:191 (+) Transcript_44712:158-730(+)